MDLYQNQYGVDRSMLNMGTAFYGYEFDSVSALWAYCPKYNCSNTGSWNYGTYIKQRVNHMGWKRHYGPIARAPYLLQEGPDAALGYITYDDPASTARKARYVLGSRRFGGVFMWDLSADYDGQGQDLLDAMYGVFSSSASRILRPTDSLRSSSCTRTPAARSVATTPSAASLKRSAIGSTTACTGASHTGSSPARCSIRIPMKRSKEPNSARWIITGRCSELSAPV